MDKPHFDVVGRCCLMVSLSALAPGLPRLCLPILQRTGGENPGILDGEDVVCRRPAMTKAGINQIEGSLCTGSVDTAWGIGDAHDPWPGLSEGHWFNSGPLGLQNGREGQSKGLWPGA